MRARASRGSTTPDEGAERDAVAGDDRARAPARIHYRQTNNEEAIRWLEAAAEHADAAGDRSTLAHAYYLLDAAHSDFGSPDGLSYLELARPIYEELGDLRGLGVVLSNLGIHAYYEGRWDESLAFYRESRDVKERAGDVIGAVIQVNNEARDPLRPGTRSTRRSRSSRRCSASHARPAGRSARARRCRTSDAPTHARDASRRRTRSSTRRSPCSTELSAERFKVEAKARRAECLVFEGRHKEALEVATECREPRRRSRPSAASRR